MMNTVLRELEQRDKGGKYVIGWVIALIRSTACM